MSQLYLWIIRSLWLFVAALFVMVTLRFAQPEFWCWLGSGWLAAHPRIVFPGMCWFVIVVSYWTLLAMVYLIVVLASWISPWFSREYSCGSHGNMLRLHSHMFDSSGTSLDIFWTQFLMDYDRKRFKWNYLWRPLSSCLGGSLVMFCSYSFGFERCIRAMTCMIILVHCIGCISVFLNCHFHNRPLSLSWCALCLQLIRFCRTSTGLPRFVSAPPLYYDLVNWGMICATCEPFSTCSIEFQHWTIFGIARAMCCSIVQYSL